MTQIIHKSPLPDIEVPELSITSYVLRRADQLCDQIAIQDSSGNSAYTYAELKSAIYALAGGLSKRGVRPGSVVGLMAPNCPEYAVAFHGAAVAGGAVTTINPSYQSDEVRHQLKDSRASLLFTTEGFVDTALAAAEGTDVREVVILGPELPGTVSWSDVFDEHIEEVPVDTKTHVVALPYSSGTTGLPKGVMLSHRNLVANIEQLQHAIIYDTSEVALAALPFFHIYGMQVLMNGLISNGVKAITMPRFDLVGAMEAIERHKITRVFAVPPMIVSIVNSPRLTEFNLQSVKQVYSGAAPLGADLAQEAASKLGCEVVQGYGMTELSPSTHSTVQGDYKPGTCGVTISNTECRIVDPETGEDQPVGASGELWVRGPQVMQGYLNNGDATRETIDEQGWLHTGDVAVIDERNHMTIVDRIKELIKYKGFQVAPAELEALLITHPKITDVAVVGVPDPEAGEVPKAFVTTAPGQEVTLEEVQSLISANLVSYKQVRELATIEAIPKSSSGKILRRELRNTRP